MPVRQMTQQEVRDWLGSGIVMPVPKQQKASTEPSLAQSETAQEAAQSKPQDQYFDSSDQIMYESFERMILG